MGSGLTDMEELLERIDGGQIKGFMREALVCYGAGAHRACIVLSFIAVFEDLREKVKMAASLNSDAKTISKDIEKQAAGQKPFETDLVNRLASKNLISALQSKRLQQMIDYRNKAAHPSGHYASAEEARFVYFEAIDSYLSKPLLQAKDFAKTVLESLRGGNFFPDNSINNIKNAVTYEMNHLNSAAHPYLVSNLVTGLIDTDANFSNNCRMFLTGLAAKKDGSIRDLLAKQFVTAKSANDDYRVSIATSISADALILRGIDQNTTLRVNALLVKLTKETKSTVLVTHLKHPLSILKSMIAALQVHEILPHYEEFVRTTAKTFWSNAELTRTLKANGSVKAIVLEVYMERAGSSDFDTANSFAKALPELDAGMSKGLSSLEALALLAKICEAANINAWRAISMKNQKFATVPELRASAIKGVDNDANKAGEILSKLGLDPVKFKAEWLTDVKEGEE